ncbi:LIP1 [Auxenochlorella protothecoides x Auxenochlorella symbiontica]
MTVLAACLALSSLLWGVGAVRPGRDEALHTGISRQWPILSEYEHRSMAELVKTKGYPLEEHFVTTSDGYVLGTYRIPHGREGASPGPTPRRPVLLQHGLLDSSATWVLNDPDQSLALILADAGWDVWLGNSRGNAYSRNHTGLGPDTAAFWDFSFDDMAAADLPALTAHVQGVTGCATLAYVGHSQGTTVALAALSTQGALRAALRPVVLLAPAISLRHIQSIPMLTLARLQADQFFAMLGVFEFMPSREATAALFEELCQATPTACVSVLTAVCGFSDRNVNASRLSHYVTYAPSGTSTRNVAHWAQAVRAAQAAPRGTLALTMYDWGGSCVSPLGRPQTCNRRVYGREQPPTYDLARLEGVPLAVVWGGEDKLADPLDVRRLLYVLPQASLKLAVGVPTFEHLDFVWGNMGWRVPIVTAVGVRVGHSR